MSETFALELLSVTKLPNRGFLVTRYEVNFKEPESDVILTERFSISKHLELECGLIAVSPELFLRKLVANRSALPLRDSAVPEYVLATNTVDDWIIELLKSAHASV